MQFPDELGRLVIQNMEILETAPSVVDDVEKSLFSAINERIEKSMPKGWDGVYDLVVDKDYEETAFRPNNWPVDDEGGYNAWYTLLNTEPGDDLVNWLSCATGIKGSALCLCFGVEYKEFNMKHREYRAKLAEFYNKNAVLAQHGFLLKQKLPDNIYRPFHFDAKKLAEDFPDFDEALKPLDDALDDLFKVHSIFDQFVKSLK